MMHDENFDSRPLPSPESIDQDNDDTHVEEDLTLNTTLPRKKGRKLERKRHGARNQDRHKNFIKWIMGKFDLSSSTVPEVSPTEYSATSCLHILDVAGGKGEVSARLTMCQRQRVVMVDPRPANVVDCFETSVLPKIPKKWQQKLEHQRQDDADFLQNVINGRFRQLVTTFDEVALSTCFDLQSSIENASLLLGLHADGATETIVDAALRYNKPFVVVPCCVFPNFFPHRVIYDEGNRAVRVRSHDQFCRYLRDKDPRFVMEELPFAGRNIAIWWDGK
ncbi:methyltransferase domain containing protein [Nitzschia inconspicua]|uniref:Methyltransferase domain containing protein n=1 Tax=Nitzschia inconspicua TaxID=303405 RepID=A0A9K3PHP4_9STRA|nr:methyltransferase domain containing protein [Nitzschia inconspicua]